MSGVDVFVPCHNYGRYLQGCIESVLTQTGCDVRVLIIDDASTDDSLATARRIAAGDPRVQVFDHPENRGHIATYNEGISWATADYLTLLSADDLLAPGALARAVEVMETRPNVGFVYGELAHFTGDVELRECTARASIKANAQVTVETGLQFIGRHCERPENLVPASGVVVRTKLQKSVGGYSPELPHSGDLEMWLRLAVRGDVANVRAHQSFTRLHASNMRREYQADRNELDYRQRERALALFFKRAGHSLEGRADLEDRARRALAWEVLWAARRSVDEGDQTAANQLAQLSRSIDNSIVMLPSWWKLAVKQKLGPHMNRRISRLLQRVSSR